MIRISRRATFRAVLTGLLAAGAITVGVSTANANVVGFCSGAGTATVGNTPGKAANCLIVNNDIAKPATIFFSVTSTAGGNQDFNTTWRASCTLAGDTEVNSGGGTAMTPTTLTLVLPFPAPDSCAVTVSATQTKVSTTAASVSIQLQFAPQQGATPTPTPTPTPTSGGGTKHLYRGLGGRCVDDSGNSSANGAKVVIWTCNSNDKAQAWTYTNSQLEHNGKCLNDQRSGGNGSKVILYTCNGGANEKWTHKSNGEFVMKANGGKYCLDDPASSKKNGTQLIVWKCNNATNQHWFASTVG
jgi:Ricin-type beta-trefoil lectin domain